MYVNSFLFPAGVKLGCVNRGQWKGLGGCSKVLHSHPCSDSSYFILSVELLPAGMWKTNGAYPLAMFSTQKLHSNSI